MARSFSGGRGGRGRGRGPAKKTTEESTKEEGIQLEGIVVENLPNQLFRIKLVETDQEVLAYLAGKMRRGWMRIMTGDKVTVEFSPYDMERCRIVYRHRG
ncbi:MAG: translation initiation factor IF-1 [Armatimonadetes bacterium]|nr:translation initiation factor IF-1 [Armatimonadota bacterium]MBS1710758.1 translation initiation factor IF-1 [Armatimonadota bacterium]MBX3108429.1 translation initiation factor IF-1 [Fimbriimonadaceae bacterium]